MIEKLIDDNIAQKTFPGIVLLIQKDDKIVINLVKGNMDNKTDSQPMREDGLFDLASLTKPLATTTSFLALCDAESINLDQKVGYFLSEINEDAGKISLKQLMTHTSGLPPIPEIFRLFKTESDIDKELGIKHLFSLRPEATPGQQVIYSCTGYILLTRILERISGCSLSKVFSSLITSPAGLTDLMFNPGRSDLNRCVPTEYCSWRGRMLKGEVHDENSYCLEGQGGNAGLFGTAGAVMQLAELFSSEGVINGKQLVSPENIRKMTTCQTPQLLPGRALGFLTQCSESFAGPGFSDGAFGHTGFTGTSLWMDNSSRLKVVALTNRVNFGREQTADKIKDFRTNLHQLVLNSIC